MAGPFAAKVNELPTSACCILPEPLIAACFTLNLYCRQESRQAFWNWKQVMIKGLYFALLINLLTVSLSQEIFLGLMCPFDLEKPCS